MVSQSRRLCLLPPLCISNTTKDIWNLEAPHVPKSAGTTAEERESFGKLLDSGFKDQAVELGGWKYKTCYNMLQGCNKNDHLLMTTIYII